jgi:nucleoside triphosphate pyrophosphatase
MFPLDRPLILASASPRRRDLLNSARLPFIQCPPAVEEKVSPGESPEAFVQRMAREKADQGGKNAPARSLVLACDTEVVIDGRILGKPGDREEAREMLRLLAGRSHRVLSAVALLLLPENRRSAGLSESRVTFHPIAGAALEAYLDTGEYQDKAGAYALQGAAGLFVERIEGSATNVIGLPLDLLPRLLGELGLWFPNS